MKRFYATVILLLLSGAATASETGILESNLNTWKAVSFWCETPRDYPCWEFYNTFAKTAQAYGIPFIYVEKNAGYSAQENLKIGYLPIALEVEPGGPNLRAKIIIDLPKEDRTVRLYEKSKLLKVNSASYSDDLIAFYKQEANAISNDLREFSSLGSKELDITRQEDNQIENLETNALSYVQTFIQKAGNWVDDLKGYAQPSPQAEALAKKTQRDEHSAEKYIWKYILRSWTPPQPKEQPGGFVAETKVQVHYSKEGTLTRFEVLEPSQDVEFNTSVKEAVTKSSTLPGTLTQELNLELLFNYKEMLEAKK
jgi:hypothetical protein